MGDPKILQNSSILGLKPMVLVGSPIVRNPKMVIDNTQLHNMGSFWHQAADVSIHHQLGPKMWDSLTFLVERLGE